MHLRRLAPCFVSLRHLAPASSALRHHAPAGPVRHASTASSSSHGQRVHMTYADYYNIVYARKQMRYSEYYEMLERARQQRSSQSASSSSSKADADAAERVAPKTKIDPHDVLGVMRGCSPEDLKAAYRRRIWALHPDRRAEHERHVAEQDFKELSQAYRVLSGADRTSNGWPKGRWHFGERNLRQRAIGEYHSAFVEFMGVMRLKRETTLPHVIRSILCDKLVPRWGRARR
jgi:hypothetical protein